MMRTLGVSKGAALAWGFFSLALASFAASFGCSALAGFDSVPWAGRLEASFAASGWGFFTCSGWDVAAASGFFWAWGSEASTGLACTSLVWTGAASLWACSAFG